MKRHIECEPRDVEAGTLREALDAVFRDTPQLEGYVLDDQRRLRRHVTVFIDNVVLTDRVELSDPVRTDSDVYVMQALSGG